MTLSQCQGQLARLARGFNLKMTSTQAEAYFERLKRHDIRDFTEAVTSLLCAPYFPKTITVIEDTVIAAQEMRLEKEKIKYAKQTEQTFQQAKISSRDALEIAFAKLCKNNIMAILAHDYEAMKKNITTWLANPEQEGWARTQSSQGPFETTYDWLVALQEDPKQVFGLKGS